MNFGAIDIGTNAARLLIGEVIMKNKKPFINKIHYLRLPLRLGENVFENGVITPEKIDKFIETIIIFQKTCDFFKVETIRACATSAMREAINQHEVVAHIYQYTEILIEVISGQQEAELILGAFDTSDIDHNESFVVVDVGGGSTEISVFVDGNKQTSQSFEIGTIRLLKKKTEIKPFIEMSTWIEENIDTNQPYRIYATGGNINKAHKIVSGKYMHPLSYPKIKKLKSDLEKLSTEQRMQRYLLKRDRADVIVLALDIYCRILKQLKGKEIFVPKIGLSDGIIYDLYKQKHTTN